MNNRIKAMRCIKCDEPLPIGDYLFGCPHCNDKGENSNVTFIYEGEASLNRNEKGLRRYSQFLPYDEFPSIGEGNTPVVALQRLADTVGLANVYTKNEFQNPTGSHKDRMNPFIIARVKELGHKVVCCASSGNEAASLAAYAAAAGIHCINAASKEITVMWESASLAAGAELIITDTPDQRAVYLQDKIDSENWYCATNQTSVPVGSSCYGIQGYKTISYELYEEFGDNLPQFILVPITRGDLLYGIYEGFDDLLQIQLISTLPRLVAIEPFPRLERVLAGENYTEKFDGESNLVPSIGGNTVTYQAELALKRTNGFAVSVSQIESADNVLKMAAMGLYLESSSALVYGGLKKAMRDNLISHGSSVLLIATSHGYKNSPDFHAMRSLFGSEKS